MEDGGMNVGARIKFLRELRGLTLEQVAQEAGVMPSTLSLWETGKRPDPYASTLRKVAQAFGCSVDYLVGLSDVPTNANYCTEADPDQFLQVILTVWPNLTDEGKSIIAAMAEVLSKRQRQLATALGAA